MLIKCPNCKKMFDDKLSACPYCGFERHIVSLILDEKKEKEETEKLKEENRKKLQALIDADIENKRKLEELSLVEDNNLNQKEEIKKDVNLISDLPKSREETAETIQIIGTENLEYSQDNNIDSNSDIFDKNELEQQIIEAERIRKEKQIAEKNEEERLKKEKIFNDLEKNEKMKNEKAEAERIEKEKVEAEKLEKKRLKEEKLKRLEEKWRENEKIEAEKREAERRENERIEVEKREAERLDNIRLEEEKAEQKKLLAQKLEEKRIEEEKLNQKKLEEMRLEKERIEAEKLEAERLEKQIQEIKKAEAERLEAVRLAAEKLEAEKKEKERIEKEKRKVEELEARKIEEARLEAEKQEKERIEAEKLEEKRKEEARLEAKRQDAKVVELLQRKGNFEEEQEPKIKITNKDLKPNEKIKNVKKGIKKEEWNYISKESISRNKRIRSKILSTILILFLLASSISIFAILKPAEAKEIWQQSIVFIKNETNIISKKISHIIHPKKVNIKLVTVPSGADIILDGVDTKKKTPAELTDIAEGKHNVIFTLKGYDDFTTEFSVFFNKGVETSLTYKLVKTAGLAKLDIKSTPSGARIFIDGKETGKITPSVINIKGGEHTIILKLANYIDFSITKQIVGDKTVTIAPRLVPSEPKGIARFVSNPIGAEIWINGNNTRKKTPYNIELKPGKYKVVIRKEGYLDWIVENIVITNGFDETFYAYMIKK